MKRRERGTRGLLFLAHPSRKEDRAAGRGKEDLGGGNGKEGEEQEDSSIFSPPFKKSVSRKNNKKSNKWPQYSWKSQNPSKPTSPTKPTASRSS
jgi:hypothetical protein